MLEYMRFSFDCLNIEHRPVSSLDKFLTVCNEYTKFRGCKHLPLHIGMDIASGLQFLHSKDVVHRDLKSENVLVCNRHYTEQQECAFKTSWTSNPVVCKLTDFGESRSRVCKTRVYTFYDFRFMYITSYFYCIQVVISCDSYFV